jgi:rod shape determining protein RodA
VELALKIRNKFKTRDTGTQYRTFWQCVHIDIVLLIGILMLLLSGILILYSASNQNIAMIEHQAIHALFALIVMLAFAQIPPATYQRWAPWVYVAALGLLIAVIIIGHIGKGAQRWLTIGFIRLQPSEIMKLSIPMLLAWYCHNILLPISNKSILYAIFIIGIPVIITAKQPDLSTAIILTVGGLSTLLLAGLSWSFIFNIVILIGSSAPIVWFFLHDYQKQRIFTFFNPERDPLGSGYHIIQSKIAIGSGGLFGKGWLNGTQSHLHFLPEHATDFIFASCGEEFGFIGSFLLIIFFMLIVLRGLHITMNAQDTFTRLLAGSLTMIFFISFFVNMCMVTGLLPVMGVPLPLISYGGSSMVTLMASFGILMSISTHRKLLTT